MMQAARASGLRWHIVALIVVSLDLGLPRIARVRADTPSANPHSAMRAAAQDAADTEPDAAKWTRKPLPPTGKNTGDAVRTSIRSAVRDEVARVAAEGTLAPGRSGNTPAVGNSENNGNGNGNNERRGPSEMGLLHSAANSAQQAKRNVNVQTEHGNGVKAHGTAGAPGQNKDSLQVGATKR